MRRARLLLLILSLLLVFGCERADPEPAAAPAEAETAAETTESGDLVTRAVEILRAVEADPAAADEILERYGVTPDEYDQMMYDIAADPELTRAYEAALGR